MLNINPKRQDENKKGFNPVVAGMAGAVAGAGVAVAATMTLKNPEGRKKVRKVLSNVRDQAMDYVSNMRSQPKVSNGVSKVKKVMRDAKQIKKKI